MLDLYDTNNWARVKFETDTSGLPLRTLFNLAFYAPTPSVFFFDGYNAKAMRKAIFPGYKSKRKPAPDNFYLLLKVFKELLHHTKHVIVEVPGYEADDVINTFCMANPTVEIQILSTDRDFCKLLRPGLTTPMASLKGVAPEDVRLYKTLCGDQSDSIDGIPNFGEKTFAKLTQDQKKAWVECFEPTRLSEPLTDFKSLGLSRPGHIEWAGQNMKLLCTYWQIIGFYDVPMDLIAQHTRVGKPNLDLANSKLKEMLQ